MMVELKGSLVGIGLPALVDLIGELHHTGTLALGNDGAQARLAFENGHLVAVEFGEEHGLPALASVAKTLRDADFEFFEGAPSPEQTLDFGPPELKSLLQRVLNGEFVAAEQAANANHSAEAEPDPPCPLLGFADDRERHYGRPTALHRCYASGSASLVTPAEQRDLCLSGRFATCPRYRNWETPARPQRLDEPAVASQSATVLQNRLSPAPMEAKLEVPARAQAEPSAVPSVVRKRRLFVTPDLGGVELVATGVALGLVLVFLVFAVALPALNRDAAQKPSTVAAPPPAPALQTIATPISEQPTPAFKPTAVPNPTPTSPPRLPTPTTAEQSSVAGHDPQALIDVRFAEGPAKGWLDNPPFAGWSDGAYRVQASQPARFVAIGVPTQAPLRDVLVTATLRKTGGPPGGGSGLIVRDQGPGPRDGENQQGKYYVLETGDLGDYGVWRRDGDHWVDLVPWAHSSSVRNGGSPNDLSVRAVGDELTFVVNGAQVASIKDSTLGAGGVGIFVGGDYNQVAVDRFSVALPD